MSGSSNYQTIPNILWKDERIGAPPQTKEFIVPWVNMSKALLSFTFDMRGSGGTLLDNTKGILINGMLPPGLNLPAFKTNDLEYVEKRDIDITALLRAKPEGERNVIQVNYLLSKKNIAEMMGPQRLLKPKFGRLSLDIKVLLPGGPANAPAPDPLTKFCMWDGKSIPFTAVVCPYCAKMPPVSGENPKKCSNCDAMLPPQALFCYKCGGKQPDQSSSTKVCINPVCRKSLASGAQFCDLCGIAQPSGDAPKSDKVFCGTCGKPLSPDSLFCSSCGAKRPASG